jgi:hypothetical protein
VKRASERHHRHVGVLAPSEPKKVAEAFITRWREGDGLEWLEGGAARLNPQLDSRADRSRHADKLASRWRKLARVIHLHIL